MLFKSKRGYRSIFFLVVLLMVASACQKQSNVVLDEPVPFAIWREKTVTFSDPAFGLTLDLPSDWTIRPRVETNPNLIDTFSVDRNQESKGREMTRDTPKRCLTISHNQMRQRSRGSR